MFGGGVHAPREAAYSALLQLEARTERNLAAVRPDAFGPSRFS